MLKSICKTLVLSSIFLFSVAIEALAQDWRASLGYSVQRYGLDITPNSGFINDIGFTHKGVLTGEVERYLFKGLYASLHGDFLVNNQESVFLGGTVNFNQTTLTANLGLQLSKVGIYGGGHLGGIWNMKFKEGVTAPDSEPVFISTDSNSSSATVGYQLGVKYYLLSYLRLHAEFRNSIYLNNNFEADPSSGNQTQASAIKFTPVAFTVGVSISIPWRSRSRLDRINSRDRLPPLMELRELNFGSPMEGSVVLTSAFGERWGRNHDGVDIDANRGDRVIAVEDGIVIVAARQRGYGNVVYIRHANSYVSRYAHLDRIRVREGETIRKGQLVGNAGNTGVSTGVHLHFELRQGENPLDPQRYIRF